MVRLSKGGLARPGLGNGDSCYIRGFPGHAHSSLTVESMCATLRQSAVAFSLSQRVNPQNPYFLSLNFRFPRIFFRSNDRGLYLAGSRLPSWSKWAFRCPTCPTRPVPSSALLRPTPPRQGKRDSFMQQQGSSGNLGKPALQGSRPPSGWAGLSSGVGWGGRQESSSPLTWPASGLCLGIRWCLVSTVPVSAPRHRPGSGKKP